MPPLLLNHRNQNRNYTIQFLVKLFFEMKPLIIRSHVNDTIEYVLDLIQLKAGIPLNEQLLIYKSKQLYPEQTLGECSGENDAVFINLEIV